VVRFERILESLKRPLAGALLGLHHDVLLEEEHLHTHTGGVAQSIEVGSIVVLPRRIGEGLDAKPRRKGIALGPVLNGRPQYALCGAIGRESRDAHTYTHTHTHIHTYTHTHTDDDAVNESPRETHSKCDRGEAARCERQATANRQKLQ
jgi:hypothetical protein